MKRATSLLCMALAACSPAGNETAPTDTQEAHPATSEGLVDLPTGARAPLAIEGEWRVAGVDREEIDIEWAMTASIDDEKIEVQSQCLRFWRPYTLDGTTLSMPEVDATSDVPPPPSCVRPALPEEDAVSTALRSADTAFRLPDGSLVLDGPGGSITLFTQ